MRAFGPNEHNRLAVPVALFYGALFVVYGTHVPYMPVWLDWRGLSAAEISAVMAAPFFIRLFITPAVALAADRQGAHRRYIMMLSWLALVLVFALAPMRSFWPIILLTVPLIVANSTMMPLIETVAVHGMRRGGLDYGRVRLWGSLTFVIASFLGGIAIQQFGGGVGIWLIALGCLLTVAAGYFLPRDSFAPETTSQSPLWHVAEPRALLAEPRFRRFLVAAGFTMASHATFLTFATLLWQKQGLSGAVIGGLWAIGVLFEIILFAVSKRVTAHFGPAQLILIGAATSLVRWLGLAFEPSLLWLIPLQIMHGVTYGATHIGAIHFMHDAVDRPAAGSAQALYATVASGVAMGFATIAAGYLYAHSGSDSYFAMAVISAVATIAALRLTATWDGKILPLQLASVQPQSAASGG